MTSTPPPGYYDSLDFNAPKARDRADTHRTEYLRHWRDYLGFAYLTLGRPV